MDTLSTNNNSYIVYVVPTYLLERIVHTSFPPMDRCRPAGRNAGRWPAGGGKGGCDALNAKFSIHFLPDFCIYCQMGAGSRLKNLAVRKNLQIGSEFGQD